MIEGHGRWAVLAAAVGLLAQAAPTAAADGFLGRLIAPCAGDCAVAVYGGRYVENAMTQVLLTDPDPPWTWDYVGGDRIVAATIGRRTGTLWGRVDLEPEVGIGRRLGRQDTTEFWGALYLRYRGFPWDGVVATSVAVSTGLNWASGISQVEIDRARDGKGSRLMHFFAPEITFARPDQPQVELLFRLHHRSGVFGLVSDAIGGSQYGSVGLRLRF